jgi:hypothetical protein
VLERAPLEKLQNDEGLAVVLSNLENRADVRVIECRGGASFALESFQRLPVFGQFFWEKFERDETTQSGVLSLVHDTHAAAAQFFQDVVMRNCLADHRKETATGRSS